MVKRRRDRGSQLADLGTLCVIEPAAEHQAGSDDPLARLAVYGR
jgi:hypothetical protein